MDIWTGGNVSGRNARRGKKRATCAGAGKRVRGQKER